MNKTRSVRHLAYVYLPPSLAPFPASRLTGRFEDRASRRTQSDVVQLTRLPGFGPKKVARLDRVFEQPFHMGTAGDALPAATVSSASASAPVTAATSVPAVAARPSGSRGDRGSACGRMGVDAIWDIELDVNSPSPEPAPVPGDAPSRRVCEEQERYPDSSSQIVPSGVDSPRENRNFCWSYIVIHPSHLMNGNRIGEDATTTHKDRVYRTHHTWLNYTIPGRLDIRSTYRSSTPARR